MGILVGTALAHLMNAQQAWRQVSRGSGASGLTIYGHSVEQRESSLHTTHNLRNHVSVYVIITLSFLNSYIQGEAPERVCRASWFSAS